MELTMIPTTCDYIHLFVAIITLIIIVMDYLRLTPAPASKKTT